MNGEAALPGRPDADHLVLSLSASAAVSLVVRALDAIEDGEVALAHEILQELWLLLEARETPHPTPNNGRIESGVLIR